MKTNVVEWIVPCDTISYDLANALRDLKIIDWHQSKQMKNAQVGDLVYLYCKTQKEGFIGFKGAILAVNKTESTIDDSKYKSDGSLSEGPCFEVAMFREFDLANELSYSDLKAHGLKSRLKGPILVKDSVAGYLHECDMKQKESDHFSGDIPDTCLVDFPIEINEDLSDVTSKKKTNVTRKETVETLDDSHSEEEIVKHARSLSKKKLRAAAIQQGSRNPKVTVSPIKQYARDVYVAEYTKERANGICQLCGNPAPFIDKDGKPYLESHHIVWLSDGGSDTIDNTAALCPNCHRKMHYVNDANDVKILKAINKNS